MTSEVRNPETAVDYDPFADATLARVVPALPAQREVWLAAKLAPEASLAYNEAVSLELRGALDAAALRTALRLVVAHHDALRTTFSADGTELCIAEQAEPDWNTRDLLALPQAERDAAIAKILREVVEIPFDLERGPLLKAELLKRGEHEHLLVLSAHHLVCDGWSWGVIVHDLGEAYRTARAQAVPDLPPAESLADYALAESAYADSEDHRAAERYWLSRFANLPTPLELPTDRARPRVRSFASQRRDLRLEPETIQLVTRAAAQEGASLYAFLLTAFAVLLQRLSGQADLVIGVPAAGQALTGWQRMVGHAVNILPLRATVTDEAPFDSSLKEIRSALLDAFEYGRYTFGTLLTRLAMPRDSSRLPLVSVLFNLDRALRADQADFDEVKFELTAVPRSYENFEIFINAVQLGDGALSLECQFNSDLFDAETIEAWLRAYAQLLASAAAEPHTPSGRLPWLDARARQRVLHDWNDTFTEFPRDRCLHQLIEEALHARPDAIAVVSEQGLLTGGQLNAHANRLAHHLRGLGLRPNDRVAVCAERSLEMVIALLAVLKAGGAYVPLDPGYPRGRLSFMLEDSRPIAILTQRRLRALLEISGPMPVIELDAAEAAWANQPDSDPHPADVGLDAHHLAYVIYTSGSTGVPKGAMNEHRAIVNRLLWMQRAYRLDEDDAVLQKTPFSFDVSVWEFFWPLLAGARLVMAKPEGHKDPAYLAEVMRSRHITTMHFVPSMLQAMLEQGGLRSCKELKRVVCSGEALPAALVAEFCRQAPHVALYNLYGPTEAAVDVTAWTCTADAQGRSVPIGRPIANTSIYILDRHGAPVPVGAAGELFIGGVQVGRGYLDKPQLTAERFLPDPFANASDARMYKSGDLARWRSDGVIEYLGRNDFQVKLRGLRIELGEIENRLASHPDVAQAVVALREDRPGDPRLIAYLSPRGGARPDSSSLRSHLRADLPEYMVPAQFVILNAIPLLPNGKIDRKALPAPEMPVAAQRERIPPRDARESRVAAIMEEVLALPGLGVEDDFFALGGHSLLAAQLTARLNREFGASLSLRAVFDHPTIAGLAAALGSQPTGEAPRIEPLADPHRAPLSKQQLRLWLFEKVVAPGTSVYNAPSAHRLRGALDEAAFQRAFDTLVQRQTVLRTAFAREGETPVQIIQDNVHVPLFPSEDLTRIPQAEREAALMRRMQELADQPFELERAPLFLARMFRLSESEHVFFFMPHHIIWDGWSFDLFYDEFAALYRAFRQGGESPLPPLPATYGDYAAWHGQWLQSAEFTAQRSERTAWWGRFLERTGAPQPLPSDYPREGREAAGPADTIPIHVPEALAETLRDVARDLDATLYTVLVAAYAILIGGFAGTRSVTLGMPARVRRLPELEGLMGHFTNMLPLGLELHEGTSFDALLAQVRQRVLDALNAHDVQAQELRGDRAVRAGLGDRPLFATQLSFQDARKRQRDWGGLAQSQVLIFQRSSSDEIGAWLLDHGHGMTGGLLYRTDLFKAKTGRALAQRYLALLETIARDPHQPIEALLVEKPERQTGAQPGASNVPAAAAAQAARTPQRIALECRGVRWPYSELVRQADAIARALRARGIGRGELVGVCMPRCPQMLAALLGIQRAGAAYVPLDPAFPAERLRYMASHARLRHVIIFRAGDAPAAIASDRELLELDGFEADAAPSETLPDVGGDDLAYVLYTSGSTGKPKGVRVLQRNLMNFLGSMQTQPGMGEHDILCAVTTLSFDIAGLELYLPLLVGARIVLATEREQVDPAALSQLLRDSGATVLQTTPTLLRLLVNSGHVDDLRGLKLLVGGEPLPRDLAEAVLPHCRELWNLYGPTETTIWSTVMRVRHRVGPVPLGIPIANTAIYLLDDDMQRVPEGVAGEIWIGGAGVADGYLHDARLTDERFRPDPFANNGTRMYRTGDLGSFRDGVLHFHGRADDQIKLRGHRIEPAEVEAVALARQGVREAVVVVREFGADDRRLVLYVAANPDGEAIPLLREHLRAQLPTYMVPQHIEVLPHLPRTPNGKVDRKSLPAPAMQAVASTPAATTRPASGLERMLMRIWCELLQMKDIGVDDDFFDLGGDSLLAVRAFERMQKLTGVNLPLASLLTAPTIARQAAALRAAGAVEPSDTASPAAAFAGTAEKSWSPLVPIQPNGKRPPLFCIHAVGGNVLNYVPLAKALGNDQPFYGVQAVGLDGLTPPLDSLPDMAARYLPEIRAVQPNGPYFLGGGSMGGMIAYEIARQLKEQGGQIGLLALFDTYGPANRRFETERADQLAALGRALHERLARARGLNAKGKLAMLMKGIGRRVHRVTDALLVRLLQSTRSPLPHALRYREIERVHERAHMAYKAPPSDISVTLFRASEQCEGMTSSRTLGWDELVGGAVEVIEIPGNHDNLIEQPALAESLKEVLQRAQTRAAAKDPRP